MAVIINEFEVVVEPPASAASDPEIGSSTDQQAAPVQVISPHDMQSVMRMQYERLLRVRAD